ncbi:hypothetical protein [Bradyrhizobium sp. USDA 3256]
MNIMSPVAAPPASISRAPAILAAAHDVLGYLERGERIDATTLRAAVEAAFGASDADGAWDWKTACDASATVLFFSRGSARFRRMDRGGLQDGSRACGGP